jgi:hypothetical protein
MTTTKDPQPRKRVPRASAMQNLGEAELVAVLYECYETCAPRTTGMKVLEPVECANLTDEELDGWDHDGRFLGRRIARCIISLNRSPRESGKP